jgi:hypothetical protein
MKYLDAIKRFAQTFIDVTEKNVPPVQVGNFHRGGAQKKPKQTRGRLLSLQENLFGRKIGVSKKSKREVRHASKVQIDQTLPQRRRPHLCRPRQQ